MKKYNSPISAQLVIPASFAECLTYEKQILWLKKEIDSLSGGGDPDAIAELQRRVTTLESNYNELQRQINNLPIETIENELTVISADIQMIKNSLDTKQDVLTFDDEPTAGSSNPVRSEGILEAIHNEGMRVEQLINGKVDKETFNEAINNIINNYVTNGDLTEALTSYAKLSDIADMATKTELANYATKSEIEGLVTNEELAAAIADLATKSELANKQDKLTFDNTPTEGSSNPVTSGGIYEALQNVTSTVTMDDSVTAESSNPVKSSGIYSFVKAEGENLATKDDIANFITEEALTGYATKTELADYATKTELADYATKTELADYATKTDISDMATKTELANYATKSDISDMATKTELGDYAKTVDLEVYATKAELGEYVKDEELATELTNYATKTELGEKQNTLTFDNTPTEGSSNPVTSDGIKKAIDASVTTPITVDSTVSQSSENPVSSNGIYNFVLDQMGDLVTTEQLATKQDKLTFDQSPTSGSSNPVTSNGIYSAIQTATQDVVRTEELSNYATKSEISDMATKTELANYATKSDISDMATKTELTDYATKTDISDMATKTELADYATKTELADYATTESVNQTVDGKQDKLTFDQTPTSGSSNPVTSGGIYSYVENKVSDMETKTNASNTYATKAQLEAYATTESVNQAVEGKQDKLTFDQTPTPNSTNPVTSGGVYAALQASGGDWYNAYYTEDNKIYIDNTYTSGQDINIAPSILCKDISDDIKLLKFTFILNAANSFAVGASIILKSSFFSFTGDAYPVYIDENGNVYGLDTLNVMLYDSSLVNDRDSVKGNYQFLKYTSDKTPNNNAARILNNSPSTAIGAVITWICVGTKLTIPPA